VIGKFIHVFLGVFLFVYLGDTLFILKFNNVGKVLVDGRSRVEMEGTEELINLNCMEKKEKRKSLQQ
jgi:hypothetical protein